MPKVVAWNRSMMCITVHSVATTSHLQQATLEHSTCPSLAITQIFYYLGLEHGLQSTMAKPRYWEARDSIDRNSNQRNTLFGSKLVSKLDRNLGGEAKAARLHPSTHHPMRDPNTTAVGLGEDSAQMFKGTQRGTNYVVFR